MQHIFLSRQGIMPNEIQSYQVITNKLITYFYIVVV